VIRVTKPRDIEGIETEGSFAFACAMSGHKAPPDIEGIETRN